MNQLTKKIGEALSSHLNAFHVYTARSALIRKTPAGWQAITLDLLSAGTKGFHKIASHGQVRIDALETIYTPLHPYLDPKQAKIHATLAVNCDQLLRDESLIHGVSLDSEQEIFNFAKAYAQCIQSSVVP